MNILMIWIRKFQNYLTGVHYEVSDGFPYFDIGQLLVSCSDGAGILSLPVTKVHALMLDTLRRAENTPPHNDPFDRMLIAQAKAENMILLTHDHSLAYTFL